MRCPEEQKMLRNIQILDFVLYDLALFLDTHPKDKDALEHYNHFATLKAKLTKEFSAQFYPLTLECAISNKEWSWGMAPLPWEGDC